MNLVLLCILLYIVLQLGVAFVFARRPRTEADYLLAGRRLGPWLATFSVFATWFGAETCIGAAAETYRHGLSGATTDPFGYGVGILLMGLLFAAALWRRGLLTFADLFRQRYGAAVERLASLVMIPSALLWAAAQMRAMGQVLASASELGIVAAITLAALVVIVYTAVGGMWADAVTDLVQGLVLIAGIVGLGAVFLLHGGAEALRDVPSERLAPLGGQSPLQWLETFLMPVLSTVAAGELVARVLAARSATLARRSTIAASGLYVVIGIVPVLLGLGAAAVIGADVDPEQLLPHYARRALPLPLYLLFVGALVSAILSTLSGALLVAGSLAAHNLLVPIRPDLGERAKIRANRIAVVLFGVVAFGLALASDSVYELVQQSSGFGSAGLLVLMLFALCAPRIGGALSACAALGSSVLVYVLAAYMFELPYPYFSSIGAALAAYLLCLPWSRAARRAAAPA